MDFFKNQIRMCLCVCEGMKFGGAFNEYLHKKNEL